MEAGSRISEDRRAGPQRLTFRAHQRLKGRKLVDAVYKGGKKRIAFPLQVMAVRREDNGPSRLGISIGTRCGDAPRRNLVKRRLREAYRLMQHELPVGTDWLVVVRPHEPLGVGEYQLKFRSLLR